MKASSLLVLVAGLGVTLVACGPGGPPSPGGPPEGGPDAPVLSPNAEPLTGGPLGPARPCAEMLAAWGRRVGVLHDGMVSRADFLADAEAQFARMDLDHDGFITADELSDYREPFRPRPPQGGDKGKQKRGEHPPPGGAGPGGFGGPPGGGPGGGPGEGGGRATRASSTDPVMSADSNLDFRVSREEFLAQASMVFEELDRNHAGRLDAEELARFCPAESERR